MGAMFGFWGKAINGVMEGGFSGASRAMKTAWKAGADEAVIRKGFKKAAKELGDGSSVKSGLRAMKNNGFDAVGVDELGSILSKNNIAGDTTIKAARSSLREGMASKGYMNGFQKAGAVGMGYQGYRKLRDPDHNVPMVPFL